MIVDSVGDQYSARLSQRVQPRRHVHPITENVMLLNDHIAKVDTNPELDSRLWSDVLVAFSHSSLHLDSAADGIHYTRKLRQEAVSGVLYNPPPMLTDFRIDQFSKVALEPLVGALLVSPHQP
jgi:hypothetical protein